jgi:hypothetical protein
LHPHDEDQARKNGTWRRGDGAVATRVEGVGGGGYTRERELGGDEMVAKAREMGGGCTRERELGGKEMAAKG